MKHTVVGRSIVRMAAGGALGALLLAASSCHRDVSRPDMFYSEVCTPPASLIADVQPQPFSFSDLRAALEHVAGPMAAALGSSEKVQFLSQAMTRLATASAGDGSDTACRLLYVASDALAAIPETPENLPDREGIRTVLLIAAGILKTGTTQ